MQDTYRTISTYSEGLYKEKGSKFLAFAWHVENEDDVKSHLAELRKKYFDARHHCYAYSIGATRSAFRMNDDGEPSGTGGKPIYGQLLSFNLTDILVVVVRYFGGVLLGTSGLANAYKSATREALSAATVVECTINHRYEIGFKYELMNDVMHILKENNLTPKRQQFDMQCKMEFNVRLRDSERIRTQFERLSGCTISLLP